MQIKNMFTIATVFFAVISCITLQEIYGAGISIDAGSSMSMSVPVPVGASSVEETWIRVVTDPSITPISFQLQKQNNANIIEFTGTANNSADYPGFANLEYKFNFPASNVYSIRLHHGTYRTVSSPETWNLKIINNSNSTGIFAVYIGDSALETEGGNVWLRDNATFDPSGFHTLSNPNYLDTTQTPTSYQWWQSPDIRFTDQNGAHTKNPIGGQPNNVYVRVHNVGTLPIGSVTVEAYWANASAGLPPFPSQNWNPLGSQQVLNINPGTSMETGSFLWHTPPVPGSNQPNHFCVFARVATSVGTLDPINYSSNVVDVMTPNNTNATHRNVVIISSKNCMTCHIRGKKVILPPPEGLSHFFIGTPVRFYLTNPLESEIFTELRIKGIPVVARTSQILVDVRPNDKIELQGLKPLEIKEPTHTEGRIESKKTGKTSLGIVDTERISLSGLYLKPGEQRLVEIQFCLSELIKGPLEIPIDAIQLVGDKVMGGMTYVLDVEKAKDATGPKPFVILSIILAVTLVVLILIFIKYHRKKLANQ